MSIKSTSYVLDRQYGSHVRKLIMLVIADFSNDDGEAWPSIDTLAFKAECSRRAVQDNIQILQEQSELQIRKNAGPRACNLYRIIFKNTPVEYKTSIEKGVQEIHPCRRFTRAGDSIGGAASRRPDAPEPLGTVKEPLRERESANAPRSLASSFPLDEYAPIIARLNHCRPGWEAAPVLNAKEIAALKANLPCLNAILPETWLVLKDYLAATMPEGSPAYQPRSRERFISAISDVVAYAVQWDRKRPKKASPVPKATKPVDEEPPLTIEETLAILKMMP